ncbi:SAC3 family protein [Lachnellula suecica]|uniref:SAC3 family protein n=1 Tax=Lachnellula suecica TaxID=602035 RepID=A0A8T9CD15_9HELO|nr:SAC3 family protein [Lachnellula suecica]
MPRKGWIDRKTATHFTLVHRPQNDPLIHDAEASSMVLNPTPLPNANKVKKLDDLVSELGSDVEQIRDNEGEAANYGVYYDDTEYDYMQHMRDLGAGGGGAYFVEAPAPKSKGKGKQTLEDALKSSSIEDRAVDLFDEEMLPSKNLRKATYQAQQDVPDALAGFQPDMDPRLREVLEALEDEAYVEDDDDIFGELAKDGEEIEEDEFEQGAWDEEDEGWESDDTAKPTKEYKDAPIALESTENDQREDHGDGDWMEQFSKYKREQKPMAPVTPSDLQSSLMTTTTNGGRKKKRKGALTNPSTYSMTSSSMFRTEGLTTLDARFEKIEEQYNEDMEDMDDTASMSNVSAVSTSSVQGPLRGDFDSIMDEFLGGYSASGKKHIKKGKYQSVILAREDHEDQEDAVRVEELQTPPDHFNAYNSRGAGKLSKYKAKNIYSSNRNAGTSSSTEPSNTFEQERLDNAAKREQRDTPAEPKVDLLGKSASPAPTNAFGSNANTNAPSFSSPGNGAFNPFLPTKQDANPSSAVSNPFGAPSQPGPSASNFFGKPSGTQNGTAPANLFGAPSQPAASTSGVFGMPSGKTSNQQSAGVFGFGAPAGPKSGVSSTDSLQNAPANSFGAPSTSSFSNAFGTAPPKTNGFPSAAPGPNFSFSKPNSFGGSFGASTNGGSSFPPATSGPSNLFGAPKPSAAFTTSNNTFTKPGMNGKPITKASALPPFSLPPASRTTGTASTAAAAKIDQLLRKERIVGPAWPKLSADDPNFKTAIETFWRASKDYRNKVRAALIRAGLFDDPDKPKKLSEAIDFNGICEDMCPEFEKANRIYERNYMGAETEVGRDGQPRPAPHKMIKAFARSAAGQDAPLPMDVRSPAALRRTLDYLFQSVLGDDEGNLPKVHHFLWDRTREIRRDFVFQQASINTTELPDRIYCLEHITRFHVIALHQMSKEGVTPAEEFSEQQEVEQLGKTLLSLIQTYEDCKVQGVECENEAEFRSYYALLNGRSPGILQTVQDWGWKYWGESDQIRTAVTLVEALQNTWDTRGPLKPQAAMDVAQNAFSRFFTIVADKKLSYTMACFAEIHFNSVRKSILKTILASYRKQRDQTKDWTLSKLNDYLRFDDEGDINSFAEAYGLRFDEVDGEDCLSFESEGVSDPFPPLKQKHSYDLVERKRGYHSLLEVIYSTVYDEGQEEEILQGGSGKDDVEEDSLFVKDDSATPPSKPFNFATGPSTGPEKPAAQESAPKPSLFDRISPPTTFGNDFFTPKPAEQAPATQPSQPSLFPSSPEKEVSDTPTISKQPESLFSPPQHKLGSPSSSTKPETPSMFTQQPNASSPFSKQADTASIFSKQPAQGRPSIMGQPTPTQPPNTSIFNFGQTPSLTPAESNQGPLSLGNYPVSTNPSETSKPSLFPAQNTTATASPLPGPSHTPTMPTNQSPLPRSSPFNTSSPLAVPAPTSAPVFPPVEKLGSAVSEAPQNYINSFQTSSGPSQMAPSSGTNQPRKLDRKARLDGLANWVALGDDGLLEHFTELTVENLLRETVRGFTQEQHELAVKEAEKLARQEADQFRQHFLGSKYFNKWRESAHHSWQKRQGRENRRAMREMAESMRASKAIQSANIVQDFRSTITGSRRGSLESLLDATGILNGVHDSHKQIQAIVRDEDHSNLQKTQRQGRSAKRPASNVKAQHRVKPDDPLRRSLMSDSSYLNGGSRIHLMPTYDAKDENRRQVSGVQTDYFRLKARGITTLPNGTPMASSAAKDFLRHKRSFDGISKSSTPQQSSHSFIPRSVPSEPLIASGHRQTTMEREERMRGLKEKAKAVLVSEDSQSRRKRSFDEDDDDAALFERAKRVREQMDEGTKWYQEEMDRHSRSMS